MTGRSRYIQSPLSFTVNQSCVVRYRLPKETRPGNINREAGMSKMF